MPALRRAPAAADNVLAWKLPVTLMVIFDLFGQMAEIIPGLRSALAISRKLRDRNAEACVLACLTEAYLEVGQPDESIECCRSALAISAEIGDWYSQWVIRYLEGLACLSLERYDEASYYIRQSLAIARQACDIRTEGMSLTWLGAVHECLGSIETAISTRKQGVAALKQARNQWQYAYALRGLAEACHHHRRAADAIGNYQRAQEVVRQIGDRRTEADILLHLGYAQESTGQAEEARQSWQQALAIFEELHDLRANQVRTQLRTR